MIIKNILQNKINDVLSYITEDRNVYMGIAIILVILFHTQAFIPKFPILKVFLFGSIGVDVFLFLSGLGLSFSLINNSTGNFYIRRFRRVFPLFFIFALIKTVYIVLINGIALTPFDWFCNLTSLSYYHIGGTFIDWYISSILLLYLLFPILYKITNLKSVVIITISICLIYYFCGRPHWIYDCLLGRLPIFLTGILAYKRPKDLWVIVLLFWLLLPFSCYVWISTPFINTLCVTLLFLICTMILLSIQNYQGIKKVIDLAGKHSLELYIGNCLAMLLQFHTISNKWIAIISYFILTIFFSCVLNYINQSIQRLLVSGSNN